MVRKNAPTGAGRTELAGRKTNRVACEQRRDKVMSMALAGGTAREIGRQLDVHHTTVSRDIKARLAEMAKWCPSTATYRELHRQRLEKLLTTWWLRALEDQQALDAVIRLLSREAKLLGLDEAKVRLEHSGEIEVRPDLSVLSDEDLASLRAYVARSDVAAP